MPSPDRSPPSPPRADSAAGDLRAFEELFHRHYGPLCEFVRGYVQSREVAEELVQELFVRLWELQSGPGAPALAVSYLYTAARNRAIGHLRHERVRRRWAEQVTADPNASLSPDAAEPVHHDELAAAVEHAVAALPERCRLVFTMSRHQGLSHAEIAQALGISVSTVETQISRALKSLRVKLAPFLGVVLLLLG